MRGDEAGRHDLAAQAHRTLRDLHPASLAHLRDASVAHDHHGVLERASRAHRMYPGALDGEGLRQRLLGQEREEERERQACQDHGLLAVGGAG